jgi:hypothetical protein
MTKKKKNGKKGKGKPASHKKIDIKDSKSALTQLMQLLKRRDNELTIKAENAKHANDRIAAIDGEIKTLREAVESGVIQQDLPLKDKTGENKN